MSCRAIWAGNWPGRAWPRRLGQDLLAHEFGHLRGHVHVRDLGLGGLQVFGLDLQVGDGVLQAVLQGAQVGPDLVLEMMASLILSRTPEPAAACDAVSGAQAEAEAEPWRCRSGCSSSPRRCRWPCRSGPQLAGGAQSGTVVGAAGEVAVQQVDAVEVRGVGDSGDLRGHGLVFGVDDQTLVRGVGAGGRLFGSSFMRMSFSSMTPRAPSRSGTGNGGRWRCARPG